MADLAITAANVGLSSPNPSVSLVQVGENVTQGQPAYLKTSDNKYYRAKASGTAEEAKVAGIFITASLANGYAMMIAPGCDMIIGGTLSQGVSYFLSLNVGMICLASDLASTNNVVYLGTAKSTTVLAFQAHNTGAVKP